MMVYHRRRAYLSGKEETGGCNAVSVEMRERVEGIEPVHVHDGRVDAQLGPGWTRGRQY